MANMKNTFFLFIILVFTNIISAQNITVEEFKLKKDSFYASYEKDVVSYVNWLIEAPIEEHAEKRKNINKFLLAWLKDVPYLAVDIDPEIVNFLDTSPSLFMIFVGGWTKYSIETQDFKDKIKGNIAGVEVVIYYYKKNKKFFGKDDNVEKLIKMKKKGTLEGFVQKRYSLD